MEENKADFEGKNNQSKEFVGFLIDGSFLDIVDIAAESTGFNRSEFIRMVLREKIEDLSLLPKREVKNAE